MLGNILKIQRYSMHDGPGLRTSVFLKGCPLRCLWCHNPESWSFDDDNQLAGENGELHYGRPMTALQVMREIDRDIPFYDESGGGVTLTGGEPLSQASFLVELLPLVKTEYIHTALDTSGYASWESFAAVLPYINLVLFDLKHMDDRRHIEMTGVSNSLILSNLRKLAASGVNILVRIPVIPGINTDKENIASMGVLLQKIDIRHVELLPYHDMGRVKYKRMGLAYPLDIQSPDKVWMESIAKAMLPYGLSVRIGGTEYEQQSSSS